MITKSTTFGEVKEGDVIIVALPCKIRVTTISERGAWTGDVIEAPTNVDNHQTGGKVPITIVT